jgi:ATP-dependent RNA helicase DeaD
MEKFKLLGISDEILKVIVELGFSEPSEIQEKTIPLAISGRDVIGKSATGSGKTLAFSAGIIDKIVPGQGVSALILTPTRELADQVSMNIRNFSRYKGLRIAEIYGGVSMFPQIKNIRKADIIVGTPGRIKDHLNEKTLNLSKVKFLVLDEADRMLDMGFIRDVEYILNQCPKERQTLLFSATISDEITHIAKKHMINPISVSVNDQLDPSQLYQKYYDIHSEQKFSLLLHLLKLEKNGIVMVFCNTRSNVDKLAKNLNREGVHCMAIHGGLSQNRRSDTLKAFHERDTLVLICTDIAARGLDIKDVSHIYNFDIPSTSDEYIHRIGRTARAGKNGIAISFVSPGDHSEFRQICKEKSINMEKTPVPNIKITPISFSSNADRKLARSGKGRQSHRRLRNRNDSKDNERRFNGQDKNNGRFGFKRYDDSERGYTRNERRFTRNPRIRSKPGFRNKNPRGRNRNFRRR